MRVFEKSSRFCFVNSFCSNNFFKYEVDIPKNNIGENGIMFKRNGFFPNDSSIEDTFFYGESEGENTSAIHDTFLDLLNWNKLSHIDSYMYTSNVKDSNVNYYDGACDILQDTLTINRKKSSKQVVENKIGEIRYYTDDHAIIKEGLLRKGRNESFYKLKKKNSSKKYQNKKTQRKLHIKGNNNALNTIWNNERKHFYYMFPFDLEAHNYFVRKINAAIRNNWGNKKNETLKTLIRYVKQENKKKGIERNYLNCSRLFHCNSVLFPLTRTKKQYINLRKYFVYLPDSYLNHNCSAVRNLGSGAPSKMTKLTYKKKKGKTGEYMIKEKKRKTEEKAAKDYAKEEDGKDGNDEKGKEKKEERGVENVKEKKREREREQISEVQKGTEYEQEKKTEREKATEKEVEKEKGHTIEEESKKEIKREKEEESEKEETGEKEIEEEATESEKQKEESERTASNETYIKSEGSDENVIENNENCNNIIKINKEIIPDECSTLKHIGPVDMDAFCYRQFETTPNTFCTPIPFNKEEFVLKVNELIKNKKYKLTDGYASFCKHLFIRNFTDATTETIPITEEIIPLIRSHYFARNDKELPVLVRWIPKRCVLNLPRAKYLDIILYSKEQLQKENEAMRVHTEKKNTSGGVENEGTLGEKKEEKTADGKGEKVEKEKEKKEEKTVKKKEDGKKKEKSAKKDQEKDEKEAATETQKEEVLYSIIAIKAQNEPYELPMSPITIMRNACIEEGGSGVKIDRNAYAKSVIYWSKNIAVYDLESLYGDGEVNS